MTSKILVTLEVLALDEEDAQRIVSAIRILAAELHLSGIRITKHDQVS